MKWMFLFALLQQDGIAWQKDHDAALAKAKAEKKIALVHFWAEW